MKKQTKLVVITITVLVIGIAFFYPRMDTFFTKSGASDSAAPAVSQQGSGGGQGLPVNVIEARYETLENSLNVTGSLIPNEMVNLRPEIAGLVTRIDFREGEFVKKGTPLLYLRDDELRAQYDRLNYTKKLFESQENRQKQLLEREAISQEEYDIALNQFNTNLADLRLIEAQLDKTVIVAPFDGVLGLREVSEGGVISSADVISTIVNIDPIKLEFSIPERYANDIKVGAPVFFRSNVTAQEAEGKVYAIEPNIDVNTRTLKIRAESPNKDRRFLPGMFARVRLVLNVEDNAILVPSESVIPELSGYKVIVAKDGKAESRVVTIGKRTENMVQLLSGVKPGEQVLTTGILQAREGMPLQVTQIN
ncbi:MAG: efflux RND transporter periplasmic adaptor subunit [Lunatimonas sp.]|uniref:efflux RND transporter periplasmic adaptor subunit n=1 Tax=Lunatimonas sp. TaxID=2060141 RepID=UPI00263B3A4E|nr:efflux RND transporter periplasmic adaptor subunit [Lunatimonas sp.]MCC5937820.1 efflux RND transporter periplasmic adaptor subunit [Lunatimonas sp.]